MNEDKLKLFKKTFEILKASKSGRAVFITVRLTLLSC